MKEQQIRFLEIYNEYNDFYLELANNMSNSLTIICNVHKLLEMFFDMYKNDELKMDFSFTVSFIGSIFMACVHLFFDEYSYLDVKNLSKEDQKKLLLFINFYGIQLFLEGMSEMDVEKDNVEELLNQILDKNTSYEEYALELNQLEQIFLEQSNIEYNTIDEYVNDVKIKLSHFANRFH